MGSNFLVGFVFCGMRGPGPIFFGPIFLGEVEALDGVEGVVSTAVVPEDGLQERGEGIGHGAAR